MQIDFNHVRKKAGDSYNELVRFLLSKNAEGNICFNDTEIEDILFDLRCSIGAIMNTHEPNDEGFQCLQDPLLLIYDTYENSLLDEEDYRAQ